MLYLAAIRVSFVPLEMSAPKYFGFAEFLAGLALSVLAWTNADTRYRFRIRSAPVSLESITFVIVAVVGVLTLLTDLWRAQNWLVPKISFATSALWQALLAGLYLLTFFSWVIFAFIKPTVFGRWNAKRYTETLFRVIVKGSPSELAVVADELTRSAKAIVFHATGNSTVQRVTQTSLRKNRKPRKIEGYANDVLFLIANKRFCKSIIDSSPGTAWAIFGEIGELKKYNIQIQTFAKNITSEALENKNSFIFQEIAGYESGLIGHYKPLCQTMYSNYEMVESIRTLLDTDFRSRSKWDSGQWEAYCGIVLMTIRDYIESGKTGHSFALYGALDDIESATSDLYKLNGMVNSNWNDDALDRLRAVVEFIQETVSILDKKDIPAGFITRNREKIPIHSKSIYDHIANLTYEVILKASAVNSPRDLCWWIQHNLLWGQLFNFGNLQGRAGKIIKSSIFRLLYNEVAQMNRFPNYQGARILSFCLNVMGLERNTSTSFEDTRALHRAILIWTKKNFARLHDYDRRVADACLVDGISYDALNYRMIKTYPLRLGQTEASCTYLSVDPHIDTSRSSKQTTAKSAKMSAVKGPRRRR